MRTPDVREFRAMSVIPVAAALAAIVLSLVSLSVQGQGGDALVGDAERGERYFTTGYKCYACHGYDAQSGARRLVPLNYTQSAFINFVQNSPLPQMPAYNDMPAQALADVYSYVRTIAADAPEIDEIPLLDEILERTLDTLEN